ncbi:hypothetical protein ACJ41O_006134 [Fusarium nematophilum]
MRYSYALGLLTIAFGSPVQADDCAQACTDTKNACLVKPDTNRAVCASEYAACLGYNPYDAQPFVEPTACSKVPTSTVAPVVPKPTEADACARDCTEKKDACMTAPDANHAACAAEYAGCLGYNPYDGEPYVEPTACSQGASTPTATHEAPVVTAAGDRIQPAVALLALGAAALL